MIKYFTINKKIDGPIEPSNEILGKIEVFPVCEIVKRAVNTANGFISRGCITGAEAVDSADICALCRKNAGKRILKHHAVLGASAEQLC